MRRLLPIIGVLALVVGLSSIAVASASAKTNVAAHVLTAQTVTSTTDFCVGGVTTVSFPVPDRHSFPYGSYGDSLYRNALNQYNDNVDKYNGYVRHGEYVSGSWVDGHYVPGHWVVVTNGACPTTPTPPATTPTAVVHQGPSGAPYCVSSNTWEAQPDFVLVNNTDYVVDGYFLPGYRSPYAVLTSSLPAWAQNTRVLQNRAGPYTMLCNLNTGIATLTPVAGKYVDQNGNSVPNQSPWVQNGTNLPQAGIMQLATAA